MNLLRDLPLRDDDSHLRVVVECPAGSRVKLKYDEAAGIFAWSRLLPAGARFPYDFGFLPRTLAEDGDGLDAIVLAQEATYPGVVIPVRAVGAMRVTQQRDGGPKKRNDRILTVPAFDHAAAVRDIGDVPPRLLSELEAFYQASLALTGKTVKVNGWADAAEASAIVADAEQRFG